jgi:predicted DNA-binding transcriptional regulator YafY
MWPMSRTERLFDLIDLLRSRRMPVTADQLSADLGVSSRSVYRDINTLRALGASIDGEAGIGYQLRPGFLLPPLMLTSDELDALTLGASWVGQRADPALAAAARSALAKINTVLPDASRPLSVAPPLMAATPNTVPADPVSATLMREAIRKQRKVRIVYRDADGCISKRTVWPIALAYLDDIRILAAWCEARGAFRHFRMDRLQGIVMLDDRYPERRDRLFRRWREQDPMSGMRS